MNSAEANNPVVWLRSIQRIVRACRCAWVVPVLAGWLPAHGLEFGEGFHTQVWTMEDGLPDSSVTTIAQTPDGYLWVGTYNGLVRFDGMGFETFDPDNTPALAHARVRKLYVDQQGGLWINTFDGSLTRLRDGAFVREWTAKIRNDRDIALVASASDWIAFSLDGGNYFRKPLAAGPAEGWEPLAMPNRNILALAHGNGQCIAWFNGAAKRMWRLVGLQFEEWPEAAELEGRRIRSVAAAADGRVWVGTDQGLAQWTGQAFVSLSPINGESPMEVPQLCHAPDGGVWAVVNGGLCKFQDGVGTRVVDLLLDKASKDSRRLVLLGDSKGGVWVLDHMRSLSHVTSSGAVWRVETVQGLTSDRVTCVFRDREDSIWAGFQLGGLMRIRESRFRTLPAGADGGNRVARSVMEDADGSILLGLLGGGLGRWTREGFTNLSFPGDPPHGAVFSLAQDVKGRLWVSAGSEDLYVGGWGDFTQVTPVVHGVKAIMADRSGRIWAGTRSGLYVSDGAEPIRFQLVEALGQATVRALAEDPSGAVWCGDAEGRLFRMDAQGAEVFQVPEPAPSPAIWALLTESDGTVWAGTFRGGLLRFKQGKLTRFAREAGLPDQVITQVLADDEGHLWLGSQRGIIRVAKAELDEVAEGRRTSVSCILFGKSDGLPSLECSGGYQPGAWRARDGTLWFTTLQGAVAVQPWEVKPNLLPPAVLIDEVVADGKARWRGTPNPVTHGGLPVPVPAPGEGSSRVRPIRVPPGKGQMEFRFTGLSLVSPERVRYRYQLEGEDSDWVEAEARRFAHYSSLPPGNYRFRVTAANADGVWSPSPAEFAFQIVPHFYQTIWFRILVVVLAAGVVAGAVRHRLTVRFRREAERLERQTVVERERARIAKDMHDDLGSSLALIAVLGDLAREQNNPERIEKISSTARQAVKSLDEIVWAVNPRNDSLAQLIDYAGQFAVDYLRAAGVRCLLDVPDQVPARELPSNVRHDVFLVVKEALQNIVKHARATEVWLRITLQPQGVRMIISDNGRGFAGEPDDALADGLRNMRQRLTGIGGQLQIHSRVGTGTEVRLEFPWPAT